MAHGKASGQVLLLQHLSMSTSDVDVNIQTSRIVLVDDAEEAQGGGDDDDDLNVDNKATIANTDKAYCQGPTQGI